NSFHEILLDEKDRLNPAHLSGPVFDEQIMMLELRVERVGHDLVEAVVFSFAGESGLPGVDVSQFLASEDTSDAIRKLDGFTRRHGQKGENVQRPASNVQR